MSILDDEVVDAISVNPEGEVVLTISDNLEWSENEHLLFLQNKVNTYIAFVESGELFESYSKAKGRNVVFNLVARYEPDEDALEFIRQVKGILLGADVTFRYEVFDSEKVGRH